MKMIRKREGKKKTTFQVYIRYTDRFGEKKSYSKSGFLKKKDARVHELDILKKIAEDIDPQHNKDKRTMNDVFFEYMELEDKRYRVSTKKAYCSKYHKHIEGSIGKRPIASIKYRDLQQFFYSLDQNSRTLNLDIRKIVNVVFHYALREEYIDKDPTRFIKIIGKESKDKKKVLTEIELEKVINALRKSKKAKDRFVYESYCIAIYIGYYVGLRISETLALRKDDFDFLNMEVSITKRLESKDTERGLYITDHLKTKNSRSVLPICEKLKDILLEWFMENPYDWVCCNSRGEFLRYESFDRVVKQHANELGIDFHSHMLRHSFVSNLVSHDVSPKITSELTRHATISTTLDIYAHTNQTQKKKAIDIAFANKVKEYNVAYLASSAYKILLDYNMEKTIKSNTFRNRVFYGDVSNNFIDYKMQDTLCSGNCQ